MCRNIKTLFNFDPPVNADEIRAASLQFVRKISGFNKPSKANEASFLASVGSASPCARKHRASEESGGRGRQGKSSCRGEIRRLSLAPRLRL